MGFEVKEFLQQLSKQRKLFHNEKDFQFNFAWMMKNEGYDVKLEYYNGMEKSKRSYIDLIAVLNEETIAFEFKYKTKKEKVVIDNEEFDLFSQGAYDLGSYAVLKDVKRLERLVNEKKVKEAYVIFLTNDKKYEKGFKEGSLFYDFNLKDNRIIKKNEILDFCFKEKTFAKNLDEISFNNDYVLKWFDYSENLRCLVMKIKGE